MDDALDTSHVPAPAASPASPPAALDAATGPGAGESLRVTATHSERDIGTRRAIWRGFVVFAGPGLIDVEAVMDDDGEVSDLTGTYPAALYKALCQIAEESERAANSYRDSRSLTEWTISPSGEVDAVEDLLGSEAA